MTRSSLTAEQTAHLLKLYAEEGTAAAYAVAFSYGVTAGYIRKLSHRNGVTAKPKPIKPPKLKAPPDRPDHPRVARGLEVVGGYWQSTKSPIHLFPREYESQEVANHLSENSFVDAALLSAELRVHGLHPEAVRAYQRRLGVRKIMNKRDAA
jgi:hypothetical protein